MSLLKKNVIYNTLLTTSGLVLPFITFPYVTRILAPEGIGQVNFANSFIQYFVIISSIGIPLYGIREIAKVREDIGQRSKILLELIIVKAIVTLVTLIVYLLLIFSIAKFTEYQPYYLWGIATIIISIFDLNYFFSAIENFKYITIRTVTFQLISAIATFVFIKTKDDALIYFLIPIIISLLNTIVNIKYILKFINFHAIKNKLQIVRHLKPLFLLFSIIIFTSIYNLLDTTLLGFLSGNENVGYYSVASKMNKIPLSLIMVLVPIMLPRISMEFKKENHPEVYRLISKTVQFVIFLGVPLMVGLFVNANEIVILFAGSKFASSITTLRILSPVALIIGLTTNFSTQLLIPMGKDRQLLYAVFSGTLISIVLNLILIPILQHNGAAISNLVAEFVVLLICYYVANIYIKITIPYKDLILNMIICLPFIGFTFISKYFFNSSLTIFIFSFTISVIYYVAIQTFIFKNSIIIEFQKLVYNKIFKSRNINQIC